MGNACCGLGNAELLARQELLKEGHDVKKKSAFLGVLSRSECVRLQLNASETRLVWSPVPGPGKADDLPLSQIASVYPAGAQGFVVVGHAGQKLLEATADSTDIRDLWVQTLGEMCGVRTASGDKKTDAGVANELERQAEKQKEKYWKDRAGEIEQRRLDAEERKKKLGLVGMKYTAQAMAKR